MGNVGQKMAVPHPPIIYFYFSIFGAAFFFLLFFCSLSLSLSLSLSRSFTDYDYFFSSLSLFFLLPRFFFDLSLWCRRRRRRCCCFTCKKTEKSRFYCSIQLGFNSVRDGNEIGHQSSLKSLTFNWSMARYALRNSFQSQSTLIAIEFDDLDEKTF